MFPRKPPSIRPAQNHHLADTQQYPHKNHRMTSKTIEEDTQEHTAQQKLLPYANVGAPLQHVLAVHCLAMPASQSHYCPTPWPSIHEGISTSLHCFARTSHGIPLLRTCIRQSTVVSINHSCWLSVLAGACTVACELCSRCFSSAFATSPEPVIGHWPRHSTKRGTL